MSRLALGVLLVSVMVWQSSCGIFKRNAREVLHVNNPAVVVKDSSAVDTSATSFAMEEKKKLIEGLKPLWNSRLAFTTFNGKAKMRYEGKGDKEEFTSNIRIQKDRVIWVAVTALGGIVQVARIYITPDSLKLVNYLEKSVTLMPLSEAAKVLPVPADFSAFQNLIIGNVLRSAGTATDAADFGNILSLQVEEGNVIQQISFNKTDSTLRQLQMRSADLNGPTGVMQYNDYETIDNRRFSTNRTVNVTNNGDQYYLQMNFTKVDFDQPVDFPFSIPKNYKIK